MKLNLPKWAAIFLIIFSIVGCSIHSSEKKLFGKKKICTNLYREVFTVFSGGAYSAEIYSDYLTDSINFRVFIGTYDDTQNFDYKCMGDSIFIVKFGTEGKLGENQLFNKKFSLSTLRKEHKFE